MRGKPCHCLNHSWFWQPKILKLTVGYPDLAEETEILRRRHNRQVDDVVLKKVTDARRIIGMRKMIESVHVNEDLETYIASIIQETRQDRHVAVGASQRGSLAFLKVPVPVLKEV